MARFWRNKIRWRAAREKLKESFASKSGIERALACLFRGGARIQSNSCNRQKLTSRYADGQVFLARDPRKLALEAPCKDSTHHLEIQSSPMENTVLLTPLDAVPFDSNSMTEARCPEEREIQAANGDQGESAREANGPCVYRRQEQLYPGVDHGVVTCFTKFTRL